MNRNRRATTMLLFFCILLCQVETAHGQSNDEQNVKSAIIVSDKMDVLYSDIINTVSVCAPTDLEQLTFSVSECNVVSVEYGIYYVIAPASLIGKTVIATVSATIDGKIQIIGKRNFHVKPAPLPRAYIGDRISGGARSRTELTANPALIIAMENSFPCERWIVTSYKVGFVMRNEENPILIMDKNIFSDELIEKINAVPSGTVIVFYDIRATRMNSNEEIFPPEIAVIVR